MTNLKDMNIYLLVMSQHTLYTHKLSQMYFTLIIQKKNDMVI